jgi:hypothetical protein
LAPLVRHRPIRLPWIETPPSRGADTRRLFHERRENFVDAAALLGPQEEPMSDRPSSLRRWLRRYSLPLVAALGGAAGVAYATSRHLERPSTPAPTVTTAVQAVPARPAELPRDTVQDPVQIAILLDTSSSMNGLINQARSQLWGMVDEMGKATRVVNGKVRGVRVEIALYEYGHSAIPASDGYIRQVLPLTGDLDRVSEELLRLATQGGEEYAGLAIQTAVGALQWSSDPSALRFIFVAGNEDFEQGPISAKTAMAAAKAKDISVQLIHCGEREPSWAEAAHLAQTDLLTIDQDHVAQHIPSPQDAEILRLGAQLNDTYIAYGADGTVAQARQKAADASSAVLSPKVALERAQLKGKKAYHNEKWDVVDALDRDKQFLAKAPDTELAPELRGRSLEEKQRIVDGKATERASIKAKIAKLEAERNDFLAKQSPPAAAAPASLGSEVTKSSKAMATKKGYKF